MTPMLENLLPITTVYELIFLLSFKRMASKT